MSSGRPIQAPYRLIASSNGAYVGRMATEANVKTVVLCHQLRGAAPAAGSFNISAFIDGVRSTFAGEVVVGEDQMVL